MQKKHSKGEMRARSRFSKVNLVVFALIFVSIGSYAIFHSSAANSTSCDNLPVWSGAGSSITATAGGSIQAAVDSAPNGGTVILPDGNYGPQSVSINKSIRIKAQNPLGAKMY
jgi:hypothetical protein